MHTALNKTLYGLPDDTIVSQVPIAECTRWYNKTLKGLLRCQSFIALQSQLLLTILYSTNTPRLTWLSELILHQITRPYRNSRTTVTRIRSLLARYDLGCYFRPVLIYHSSPSATRRSTTSLWLRECLVHYVKTVLSCYSGITATHVGELRESKNNYRGWGDLL